MAVFFIRLVNDQHWNWVLALVVALLVGVVIGAFIGFFVARIGIPSFVVTLASVPGLPGPDAGPARRRRHLPGADARTSPPS